MLSSIVSCFARFGIVYITVPNNEEARDIAKGLIERRLVACANIIKGVDSIYKWEGKLQEDQEYILIVKSRSCLFKKIRSYVLSVHSAECPCIVMFPIQKGYLPFLHWIQGETQPLARNLDSPELKLRA